MQGNDERGSVRKIPPHVGEHAQIAGIAAEARYLSQMPCRECRPRSWLRSTRETPFEFFSQARQIGQGAFQALHARDLAFVRTRADPAAFAYRWDIMVQCNITR